MVLVSLTAWAAEINDELYPTEEDAFLKDSLVVK